MLFTDGRASNVPGKAAGACVDIKLYRQESKAHGIMVRLCCHLSESNFSVS